MLDNILRVLWVTFTFIAGHIFSQVSLDNSIQVPAGVATAERSSQRKLSRPYRRTVCAAAVGFAVLYYCGTMRTYVVPPQQATCTVSGSQLEPLHLILSPVGFPVIQTRIHHSIMSMSCLSSSGQFKPTFSNSNFIVCRCWKRVSDFKRVRTARPDFLHRIHHGGRRPGATTSTTTSLLSRRCHCRGAQRQHGFHALRVAGDAGGGVLVVQEHERLQGKRPLCPLFLCLSRACLGKLIIFSIKWL